MQSAGGPGAPKWEPRARLGIYVGHSPIHAGSVALVLNPKTGLVSPQYHVVFDDDFTTVPHLHANTVPENWAKLVKNSRVRSVDGFYDVTKTWFNGIPDPSADSRIQEQNNNPAATHSLADATARSATQDTQNGSNVDSNNGSMNNADFNNDSADTSPFEGVSTADFNNDSADTPPSKGVSTADFKMILLIRHLPWQGVICT